jgi:two-component system response regulator RegA
MSTGAAESRGSWLIVDDDEVFRTRLVRALEARGFEAQGAADHESALALARADSPEFAVVDLRLPDKSGLDVVRDLKALDETTAILVLTGYGSIATAIESLRLGAIHYLSKPVDVDQILAPFAIDATAAAGNASTESPTTPPVEVPTLARVEWEHIHRVLTDCGGNISQAARLLGLHRRSLPRPLSKFPVRRSRRDSRRERVAQRPADGVLMKKTRSPSGIVFQPSCMRSGG